jgi:hypothetical protein
MVRAAGWVKTQMGNSFGAANGLGEPPMTTGESASAVIQQTLKANIESTGGRLIDYKGDVLPW